MPSRAAAVRLLRLRTAVPSRRYSRMHAPVKRRRRRPGRPPHAGPVSGKQPIRGLIDLGQVSADDMHEPPYNTIYFVCRRQSSISGIVVNDTWTDLQPGGEGTPIDTQTIDAALQTIAAYNQSPGVRSAFGCASGRGSMRRSGRKASPARRSSSATSMRCRRRPPASAFAGSSAAGTVSRRRATHDRRFWTSGYENALRNVQLQLAKKYDDDPLVNEVSVSSCSSLTSEPFVPARRLHFRATI